jgi:hypothetical protein
MSEISPEKLEHLHSLLLKKNTPDEIAALLEVSVSTVRTWTARYFPHLIYLELYKEHKKDILRGLQNMAIGYLIEKMPVAHFSDIVNLLKVLEDKIALLEGRSNFNVGVRVRIEDLVAQKEQMFQQLREQGIPENRIEKEFQKTVALPHNAMLPAPTAPIPTEAPAGIRQTHFLS